MAATCGKMGAFAYGNVSRYWNDEWEAHKSNPAAHCIPDVALVPIEFVTEVLERQAPTAGILGDVSARDPNIRHSGIPYMKGIAGYVKASNRWTTFGHNIFIRKAPTHRYSWWSRLVMKLIAILKGDRV